MAKQQRKRKMPDPNQFAFGIVQAITGEPPLPEQPKAKSDAAIARGGKGGKARAEKLTPEQRSEIAKKAAAKRWAKK